MTEIRTAKYKDVEVIVDFQLLMAQETEDLSLDREILINGVEAVFEDSTKGTYYVAIVDEKVVACLLTTYEWSEWRNGTVLWIQSVYVDKAHRGKGIFKEMYQYLKSNVEEDPALRGIRLYVERENISAQKVYEQMGMSAEHYKLFEWLK